MGELSQWLCHDDSTINIVVLIIIIIIINGRLIVSRIMIYRTAPFSAILNHPKYLRTVRNTDIVSMEY